MFRGNYCRESEIRRQSEALGIAPSPPGHTHPAGGYPASRRGTRCALALQRVVDAVASQTAKPSPSLRPRRDAPHRGRGAGARLAGSGYPRERVGAGPRLERGDPEGRWNCS